MWTVRKHCARISSNWISLCSEQTEDDARLVFELHAGNLMQGVVQLIDPRGEVVAVESIPPLEQILAGSRPCPPRWFPVLRRWIRKRRQIDKLQANRQAYRESA